MGVQGVLALFLLLFTCLAGWFAVKAKESLDLFLSSSRKMRSELENLDLETARNSANIKRLTSSVGAMSKWAIPRDEKTDDGLPDPLKEPDAWRAAIRNRNKGAR